MTLNVYIGFDTRNDGQQLAFEICKKSILENTQHKDKVVVHQLNKYALGHMGLYYRGDDVLAATEFTYTRFLVPILNKFQGVGVFCDSDFIWECDIYEELMPYWKEMLQKNRAVYCVQHNHVPTSDVKMDGRAQTVYPRKNWSSMMLFNCGHEDTRNLTKENVNTQSPAWLHRLQWAKDENIGALPYTYNYLVGVYNDLESPKAIHYTDGGPWHYLYRETEFADKWLRYLDEGQRKRLRIELMRQEVNMAK